MDVQNINACLRVINTYAFHLVLILPTDPSPCLASPVLHCGEIGQSVVLRFRFRRRHHHHPFPRSLAFPIQKASPCNPSIAVYTPQRCCCCGFRFFWSLYMGLVVMFLTNFLAKEWIVVVSVVVVAAAAAAAAVARVNIHSETQSNGWASGIERACVSFSACFSALRSHSRFLSAPFRPNEPASGMCTRHFFCKRKQA